jgi:hypothetical protein
LYRLARLQWISAHDGEYGFDSFQEMIDIGMEQEYLSGAIYAELIGKIAPGIFSAVGHPLPPGPQEVE